MKTHNTFIGISPLLFLLVFFFTLSACSKQNPETSSSVKTTETQNVQANGRQLTVHKSPTCGCCGEWVNHMTEAGFIATVHDQESLNPIKSKLGIRPEVQSCHTGMVNNYVFEGHIPAHIVKQFLKEPPNNAIGLAVPGMPIGSPGMEMGDRFQAYDVLLLLADGSTRVYAHIDQLMDAQGVE